MPHMNRRQFVATGALLSAPTLLGLYGCGQSDGSSAASSDYGEGFTFKQGFDRDFPPYSFIGDDGVTKGFDVELCQAVCERNGWTYQAVPIDWDVKNAELYAFSCDCIWSGFTKFKDNADAYLWSEPYSNNSQMIMVKEGSSIKKLSDLAGKRVGVQRGTSAQEMLSDDSEEGQAELAATFGVLQVYDTYNTAVTDLKAGGIDAIAIDITIGNYLIQADSELKFLDEVLSEEVYAIAFRLGEDKLLAKVWEGVMALVEDGTFDTIGKKYPEIYDSLTLGK